MSDFSNNLFSDDFNGKFAVKWKEREWSRYIKESEADVGKFYNFLIKYKNISNHLDVVFMKMSWAGIINKSQKNFVEEIDEDFKEYFFYGDEGFSIHKSPVFVAARGLMFFIEKVCDVFAANVKYTDTGLFWRLIKAMNTIKENLFLGIYLIDVGELWPAICQFKQAIDFVNFAFDTINEIKSSTGCDSKLTDDFAIGLFDVRELAWQSITFCRDEIKLSE